ncbi:hypothetical protein EMQU_3068 (plasmid) [Enterococcus mundtii QU 25]|nr:hypothetical protein EMQU_3068 [Enterococcus mundtii QU 25]
MVSVNLLSCINTSAEQTEIVINGTLYPQTSDSSGTINSESSSNNNSLNPIITSSSELYVNSTNKKLPQLGNVDNLLFILGILLIFIIVYIEIYSYEKIT